MALQGAKYEIAFTTTPFVDPSTLTWTDVSAYVLPDIGGITVNRGRQYEQTSMQAGTVTFALDNRSGNFDPDNASGAHYPLVLPMLPVRISSTFSAVTYVEFFGFIESWQQTWDATMLSQAVVTANDGGKTILAFALGLGYTEQLVKDYGGTVGGTMDTYWPFDVIGGTANPLNYYQPGTSTANVVAPNTNQVVGIAETGLQVTGGGSSYFSWVQGDPGCRNYWCAIDGWFRLDTVPGAGAVPGCVFSNDDNHAGQQTPNLGWGPVGMTTSLDAMAAWLINYPTNLLAATVADPTVTTGWTVTGTGASQAVVAISTTNAFRRIYLDDGTTDFYGATKAIRLTAGTATTNWTSPFTTVAAATTYTFQCLLTTEAGYSGSSVGLVVDWYNGATYLSSSTFTVPLSDSAGAQIPLVLNATSPASTSRCQLHLTVGASTGHYDLAQMILVAGTFNELLWYAGGSTPDPALSFIVAAGNDVAPPGFSNSSYGWPCYGTVAVPAAASWFHVAIDGGHDNPGIPYNSVSSARMPSVYVDGVPVRMWTTGDAGATQGFTSTCHASVGVRLYSTGGGPIVDGPTTLAMSFDEMYVADTTITSAGEVTATKALAHYTYGLTRHDFPQQLTGARVNAVLDSVGWPTVQRAIDTGTCTIQAQLPDTTGNGPTGTSLIQDAVSVEGGLFFVARDGKATFWDQAHAAGGSPAITIGDGSGSEIAYQVGPTVSKDDTYIYNQVILTKTITDGASADYVATAMDLTSQGQYKIRQLTDNAPWATNSDMDALAAAIVTDYKMPATRIANVSVEGVTSGAFASLLPRDIGDYIAVKIRPRSSGPTITVDAYIQGITLTITSSQWLWTFALSPTLAGH